MNFHHAFESKRVAMYQKATTIWTNVFYLRRHGIFYQNSTYLILLRALMDAPSEGRIKSQKIKISSGWGQAKQKRKKRQATDLRCIASIGSIVTSSAFTKNM